jgi:predicted nucleotidyltransferase
VYNSFINSEKKGFKMFSYIDTIQNLTVSEKRNLVKSIKEMIKEQIADNRQANFERKQNSAVLRAQKKAERIAKLEAKLNALRNPVGAKAIKSNRKPSKAEITKFA